VGKERFARALHAMSTRKDKPFVAVNCAALPGDLIESELFGAEKGAYTGAGAARQGRFERADGGTLMLDELGELPLPAQAKLLRVLQHGEVERLGSTQARKVDVRVIAATNVDLQAAVAGGRFRSDLLYRLAVVRVHLPPLRARPDDIPLLVERLLGDQLAEGDPIEGPNLHGLMSYSWPGNVRELRNVLARAVALSGNRPGSVRFAQLIFNLASDVDAPATLGYCFPGVATPLGYKEAKQQLLSQFEAEYIQALMRRHLGNVSQVATAAGLSRKHVYDLLRRIGLLGQGED